MRKSAIIDLTEAGGLIDVSAWIGHLPFTKLRFGELEALRTRHQKLGIQKVFVAPIGAILEQDPSRANHDLLATVTCDFFSPVPVIDLSYANWQETLENAAADSRVRMIKLLPNYHLYELHEKLLKPLVAVTSQRNIVISIQMRVEDTYGQLKVTDLDVVQAVKTMALFPNQPFLMSNLFLHELNEVLLSQEHVYVDISSLEHIDVVKELACRCSLNQVLFSTHSPFYVPEGAVYKLKFTDAQSEDVMRIAHGNARRLFKISKMA